MAAKLDANSPTLKMLLDLGKPEEILEVMHVVVHEKLKTIPTTQSTELNELRIELLGLKSSISVIKCDGSIDTKALETDLQGAIDLLQNRVEEERSQGAKDLAK
ncbi:MAG: hypothetical protein SP1CHLAM54_00600 [Chlamydiia bacterium]|nr:hypothetical protein [Chlamydiia bacterium]MCH9614982.1 hypothetical protein [Chlamydiia bacterium]MCH9629968.1 hypothetical protein [Chlamydiia bacterium]